MYIYIYTCIRIYVYIEYAYVHKNMFAHTEMHPQVRANPSKTIRALDFGQNRVEFS